LMFQSHGSKISLLGRKWHITDVLGRNLTLAHR
jgi:hypothetical protein